MGPTTKGQEVEDLDNLVASMKARIDKEVRKKREYKKEIEGLEEYIQHLTKPLNQDDAAIPLLLNPSQGVTKNPEEEKVIAREAKEWMATKREKVATFMDKLMLTYGQTSFLLSRIANMTKAWADLQDIQYRVIPCLRVLKGMHKQELIDKEIIAVGPAYDFNAWHWALVARSEILEKVKAESVKSEEKMKEIRSKIILVTADLLEKETIRESDMRLENLKLKTQ